MVVVGMISWAVTGLAQADYAFKVLANKGANEYKSGDTWQPIKTGISLNVGDELKVSENAYLGLVSKTGKPMELKNPKNYKVADLLSQLGTGTSVMSKYTDFILSSNSAEAKKNRMSATGAVHRGTKGTLTVYLPETKNSGVVGNSMYVLWKAPDVGGPYVVTVTDFMEEELVKMETPETSVKLDLSSPKLAKVTNLLIKVSSKADKNVASEGVSVKRLTAAEMEKIKKAYDEEVAAETKTESAFNKYLLGGFYEQHGYYIDALTCYEEAVRMAPDIETFAENKADFLIRSGIAPEKK